MLGARRVRGVAGAKPAWLGRKHLARFLEAACLRPREHGAADAASAPLRQQVSQVQNKCLPVRIEPPGDAAIANDPLLHGDEKEVRRPGLEGCQGAGELVERRRPLAWRAWVDVVDGEGTQTHGKHRGAIGGSAKAPNGKPSYIWPA